MLFRSFVKCPGASPERKAVASERLTVLKAARREFGIGPPRPLDLDSLIPVKMIELEAETEHSQSPSQNDSAGDGTHKDGSAAPPPPAETWKDEEHELPSPVAPDARMGSAPTATTRPTVIPPWLKWCGLTFLMLVLVGVPTFLYFRSIYS